LVRDLELGPLLQPCHFRFGFSGKKRIYNLGEYWAYGGRGTMSAKEIEESQKCRDISARYCKIFPLTLE
jgi:hypothetical protein